MSKLSKNIGYNLLGQMATVLLGFVATRAIYQRLPVDVLGIYYFSFALNLILTQSILSGLGALITREIANRRSDDRGYVNRVAQTSTLLFWAFYLVLLLVVYLISPWLMENWVELTVLDPATATTTLRILLVGILSAVISTLYRCLLRGMEDMAFTNLTMVIATLLRQFGIVILLNAGVGIYGTAVWISLSFLIIPLALFVRSTVFYRTSILLSPKWHADIVNQNKSDAGKLMSNTVLDMLQYQADKIIISGLMPVAVFGMYTFIYNFVTRIGNVRIAVGTAALPAISKAHGEAHETELMVMYNRLLALMSYGSLPIFAALAYALAPIASFVFSPEDAQMLVWPGTLLICGVFLIGVTDPARQVAIAKGMPGLITTTNLISVAISIPAAIVLIYNYGLAGAGYTSLVAGLVFNIHFMPRVYRKCLGQTPSAWFNYIARVLLLTLLTYGAVGALLYVIDAMSIVGLVVGFVIASIAYLAGAYSFVDRQLISDIRAFAAGAWSAFRNRGK